MRASSRRSFQTLIVAALGSCSVVFCANTTSLPQVPTAQQPVTNVYHGVVVIDDYQWLEEAAAPAVRDWVRAQNERTRAYFSKLPCHDGLAEQLTQIRSEESAR